MSDKQQLAKERTDWAEDRTLMANERTFAGWMRTGMACIGVALALQAIFGDFDPTWVPKLAANLFLFASVFIFWSACSAAVKTNRRMSEHEAEGLPCGRIKVLAMLMITGAFATGAILWAL